MGKSERHRHGRAETSASAQSYFPKVFPSFKKCNLFERQWPGNAWDPLCLLRGPLEEMDYCRGPRYAPHQPVQNLSFISHERGSLPNSIFRDCRYSCSEYWHHRHLQTPQIAPLPAPVVKYLPVHHAPNRPPFTHLAVLTRGLVPCKTHWPMPSPPRLTAVPIRETTCLPRLDYACPKPIHAKYICYSNYQIR